MKFVVDTNVTIAANGRDTHADFECQFRCIEFIEDLSTPKNPKQIMLDDAGLIWSEYSRHLNFRGQPGVGDMFFKFVHDNMHSSQKVRRVHITPIADESRGFDELPKNPVDKSDRVFLAVAIKADAAIINALDSDWHEQHNFIELLNIKVKQLCPQHGVKVV